MNKNISLRTWVEVDKKALKNNYDAFRGLISKKCRLMAVVKSNAYGHGFAGYPLLMQKFGVDFFGVDSITEALTLRKNGIKKPILVLGYTMAENFDEARKNGISITISSFEQLEKISRLFASGDIARNDKKGKGNELNIHIKIDTGMHRQGFQLDEVKKVALFIKKNLPQIKFEGIYTHFAAAKNPSFPADTNKQIEQFEKAVETIKSFGSKPIKHAAATSGTIVFPKAHFDMVRIGIGMMGLWPSYETKACYEEKIKLKTALCWKTIVSEIKYIKKGESIGYDFTENLDRDSKVAILPIGYWHGYKRDLSSIGHVLIKGKRAKILGRISMDMIVIDVTDVKNIKICDEVVLLGKDGKEEVTAYELALLADTSWYEIITQINPLIKRIHS
ncbi:MAG: alanine racemase [Patescibacteria group bacterium]